jgi:hypothetical protein
VQCPDLREIPAKDGLLHRLCGEEVERQPHDPAVAERRVVAGDGTVQPCEPAGFGDVAEYGVQHGYEVALARAERARTRQVGD